MQTLKLICDRRNMVKIASLLPEKESTAYRTCMRVCVCVYIENKWTYNNPIDTLQ